MNWRKLFGGKKQAVPTGQQMGEVKAVVLSDLGNIRMNNEDIGVFYRIADERLRKEKGHLLIVADGMGGHQAGEVASQLAAEVISETYFKPSGAGIEKQLASAFQKANEKIFALASSNKAYSGMGTTCTALVICENTLYYAHVGDSRAYILKADKLERITEDHTYVQELLKDGEITQAEADNHPQRNILTNAMGTKPTLRVDTGRCPFLFEQDDRLLICSDGLYDYLDDAELAAFLQINALQQAATAMIEEAKKRGGHDNITVVLAEKNARQVETTARETRDIELPITTEHDLP